MPKGKPHPAEPKARVALDSAQYEELLADRQVLQGMDGKARWVGNVIAKRWFRSRKAECLHISKYSTPAELGRLIGDYVDQHDNARRHQSLGCETPAQWYCSGMMAA